eukprot:COSAG04_NODE_150_length_22521_cov_10.008385_5_plen_941_part_00
MPKVLNTRALSQYDDRRHSCWTRKMRCAFLPPSRPAAANPRSALRVSAAQISNDLVEDEFRAAEAELISQRQIIEQQIADVIQDGQNATDPQLRASYQRQLQQYVDEKNRQPNNIRRGLDDKIKKYSSMYAEDHDPIDLRWTCIWSEVRERFVRCYDAASWEGALPERGAPLADQGRTDSPVGDRPESPADDAAPIAVLPPPAPLPMASFDDDVVDMTGDITEKFAICQRTREILRAEELDDESRQFLPEMRGAKSLKFLPLEIFVSNFNAYPVVVNSYDPFERMDLTNSAVQQSWCLRLRSGEDFIPESAMQALCFEMESLVPDEPVENDNGWLTKLGATLVSYKSPIAPEEVRQEKTFSVRQGNGKIGEIRFRKQCFGFSRVNLTEIDVVDLRPDQVIWPGERQGLPRLRDLVAWSASCYIRVQNDSGAQQAGVREAAALVAAQLQFASKILAEMDDDQTRGQRPPACQRKIRDAAERIQQALRAEQTTQALEIIGQQLSYHVELYAALVMLYNAAVNGSTCRRLELTISMRNCEACAAVFAALRGTPGTPFVYDVQVMDRDLRTAIVAHLVARINDGDATPEPDPAVDLAHLDAMAADPNVLAAPRCDDLCTLVRNCALCQSEYTVCACCAVCDECNEFDTRATANTRLLWKGGDDRTSHRWLAWAQEHCADLGAPVLGYPREGIDTTQDLVPQIGPEAAAALLRQAHWRELRRGVREGTRQPAGSHLGRVPPTSERRHQAMKTREVWQRPGQYEVYARGFREHRSWTADGRQRFSASKINQRNQAGASRKRVASDMPRVLEQLSDSRTVGAGHKTVYMLRYAFKTSLPIVGASRGRAFRPAIQTRPRALSGGYGACDYKASEMRQALHEALKRGECSLRGIVRRARRELNGSVNQAYYDRHWLSDAWVDEEVRSYDRLSLEARCGGQEAGKRRRQR